MRRAIGTRFLRHSVAHAFELLIDQLDFPRLAGDLLLEATDLLLDLSDALVQLRLLTRARLAAQLEKPSLSCQETRKTTGSAARADRSSGKISAFFVIALRFEPRLSRRELVQALEDDCQVGSRDRLIQAHDARRRS